MVSCYDSKELPTANFVLLGCWSQEQACLAEFEERQAEKASERERERERLEMIEQERQ